MDLLGKIIWGAMIVWAGALAVGLLIAALPLIVAVIGFVLMVAVVGFVGRLVTSWLFY
jgi:hypothetical protein